MKVNIPTCDYLRLTTFRRETGRQFYAVVEGAYGPVKDFRRMNYKGLASHGPSGAFAGTGLQWKEGEWREHHMFEIAGADCEELVSHQFDGVACTRLDLQVTVPLPAGYSARRLADRLRQAKEGRWPVRGVTPRVQLVDNDDGLDTVYIGSREGSRFVRIYVKEDDDARRYLRFEVEFKGRASRRLYEDYGSRPMQRARVLLGEFQRLPIVDCPGLALIYAALASYCEEPLMLVLPLETKERDKRLEWVRGAALPAIERLLLDDTTRGRTVDAVRDVLRAGKLTQGEYHTLIGGTEDER